MEQNVPQKTILVVDDEPTVLRFVSALLTKGNFLVLTANNGIEGLERAADFHGEIDLLLSDLHMPGMTGIELAKKVTIARPKIKVLFMSGFPEGMLVLNEGWHFMAKPFINSQLRALITSLVSPERGPAFVPWPSPSEGR